MHLWSIANNKFVKKYEEMLEKICINEVLCTQGWICLQNKQFFTGNS